MTQLSKRTFRWTILCAPFLLGVGVYLMLLEPDLKQNDYPSPILGFEFVQSVADLDRLLGDHPAAILAQFDKVNRWDWAFMILYGLFLFSFLWEVSRDNIGRMAKVGMCIVPLVVLFDFLENAQMFSISANYPDQEMVVLQAITWLQIFTWAKWLSLSLVLSIAGVLIHIHGNKNWIGHILTYTVHIGIITLFTSYLTSTEPLSKRLILIQFFFGLYIMLGFLLILFYSWRDRGAKKSGS